MKRSYTFAFLAAVLATASGPAPSLAGPHAAATQVVTTSTNSPSSAEPITPARREAVLSVVPNNPRLVARLQAMLPRGTTVQEAAVGFTDQSQFVAAVQLSHNLGIPFEDMRSVIVEDGLSVGQALEHHRPDVDVGHELRRARRMAMSERY